MSEWPSKFLDDLAFYHNGVAFKPSDWSKEGIKIIRIEQLNNPEGEYDFYNGSIQKNNEIINGDLLFSWSATLKVLIWKHGLSVLNQHLFKVIPKDGINKLYLYYVLDYHMDRLSEGSHGSTMKHIKRSELKKYSVPIAPLPTQRKIARILSTIDGQIEKTEAIIAKYQAVKQGMLQDLFTRGIDVRTGQLRPRYEDAPDLYQESPLGMIPKEWGVVKMGAVSYLVTNGFVGIATPFYTTQNNGVFYLFGTNVRADRIDYRDMRYVTKTFHEGHKKSKLAPGDMLTVQSGHIGTCAVVPENFQEANCHALIITRFYKAEIFPEFVSYYLNSALGYQSLEKIIIGSTIKHINTSDLAKHEVLKPDVTEQKMISQRVDGISELINVEVESLSKLQLLKQGMMQDLLSGKVDVMA